MYLNASAYGWLGVEVNTETSLASGDDVAVAGESPVIILDAVAKIDFGSINVWAGRFLAPSDRANLSGPYYGNVGNLGLATGSRYYMGSNNNHGRDDGVAIWGNIGGDMNLKYQVGIFDGAGDGEDEMLAGRLVLNLWDNEEGYYNASTYYGEKQILAIGLSYQDGPGSGGNTADAEDALQVDVLVEKTLDSVGTVTLDAAWYDIDGVEDDTTSIFAGLLLNNEIALGPLSGKIRPYIRLVKDGVRGDETSFGVQHVIDGHKASLTIEISDTDTDGNAIGIGAQFQF